jgi:hypothetical protein
MPSFIYMHGLYGQLTVAENPDVVEARVKEMIEEDELFVTLNSQGRYMDIHQAGREAGMLIMEGEPKDSFAPIKIRHEFILAVRGEHPGEVPEK